MRDQRDPEALGNFLIDTAKRVRQTQKYKDMPMSRVYDVYMPGIAIANYGESEEEFKLRCQRTFRTPSALPVGASAK